jgi:hypothetical protein
LVLFSKDMSCFVVHQYVWQLTHWMLWIQSDVARNMHVHSWNVAMLA